jgi:hypothetical protein
MDDLVTLLGLLGLNSAFVGAYVHQDATQEQDGTPVFRQLKPKISNNAHHNLGDARPVKETNKLVLQSKRSMNFVFLFTH